MGFEYSMYIHWKALVYFLKLPYIVKVDFGYFSIKVKTRVEAHHVDYGMVDYMWNDVQLSRNLKLQICGTN